MKVSIVNAILNSPEIARRHILHYNKIGLPEDVEVIFVDDGSVPPLKKEDLPEAKFNFSLYWTNDFREWTQPAARNYGAKRAKGVYLILTDIDHIISSEVVETARNCTYDVLRFKREAGVLDENGDFTQEVGVLLAWGLSPGRIEERGVRLPPHGNSYIIRKDLYLELGGVSEKLVGTGKYPNREEQPLKRRMKKMVAAGKIEIVQDDRRPTIYMFPNGKYCGDKNYNPFGLFHDLDRTKYWEK